MEQKMYDMFVEVLDRLEDLKMAEPEVPMFEELDEVILTLIPKMTRVANTETQSYVELITLKSELYGLAGRIMNFDSPEDYIDESIHNIKMAYKIK